MTFVMSRAWTWARKQLLVAVDVVQAIYQASSYVQRILVPLFVLHSLVRTIHCVFVRSRGDKM